MKKILRFIFSRKLFIVAALLIQLFALAVTIISLSENYVFVYALFTLLSFVIVYVILNKNTNPAYKLAWIIPILLMPIFGGIIYVIYNTETTRKIFEKLTIKKLKDTEDYLRQDPKVINDLENEDVYVANLVKYMNNKGVFPVYKNTSVTYFPLGEKMFEKMKDELKKAEHFIFMEYFIIQEGKIWSEIFEILKQKVSQGVDVRILYDGMGSQIHLPDGYHKFIAKHGIKCRIFNAFRPFLSSVQNNRDHRKIMVIDGHTAFNGGVNIADEYANIIDRFGHWKDTAVMLRGDAVWSFTIMFLQMWNIFPEDNENYEQYRPHNFWPEKFKTDGFVMPYGDMPTDGENIGELVYYDIINKARKYVYITTPYLILDNEMITALGFAAKSGVDVRIIVPGIPDKKYVYKIAQAYYKELIDMGVKVYEYTPGFVHAKNFVSDDTKAVVGTINLDYRSLYLHFECATFMYKTECISEIKNDFLDMLGKCREIDYEYIRAIKIHRKVESGFLRTLGPLL